MDKIIIENKTNLNINQIFKLIEIVIKNGRVSNNYMQYAEITQIKLENNYYCVHTFLNDKSDKFIITDY